MRTYKPSKREQLRRAQPIDRVIQANQARHFNAWSDADFAAIEREIERMLSRTRVLKYDEGKKAHRSGSAASLVADAAIMNEHSTIEERRQDFVVPRKSLTEQLFLRLFKPVMHFRDVPFRVLSEHSKQQLAFIAEQIGRAHPDNREAFRDKLMERVTLTYVSGTTPAELEWKSDETLLVSRLPDTLKTVKVTRQTANTRTFEQETDDLPTWDETTPRTWDDLHPPTVEAPATSPVKPKLAQGE